MCTRAAMICFFLLALQPAHAVSDRSAVLAEANPMRKIITMLQDMAKELEREGEIEKEIFDKALCACENGDKDLQKVIDDSTAASEELTAKIQAETAEKAQLTQDVADHKNNAAEAKKDLDQASMLRDKDHKTFVDTEKDNKNNLASLGKAIPAIEQGMGGAALMQMPEAPSIRRFVEVSKYVSPDDRSTVLAFLDQGSDESGGDSAQAPQSGQILGILKNMKDEMEADLKELQAQETRDRESFDELKAAKKEEISINEKSVIEKDKRIGGLTLSLSQNKNALEDAQEELANAQKFLANMKEQCANMEKNKNLRAKMRAAEIQAVSEAVKILNDDDALEVFAKSKGSAALVQQPSKKTYDALLQLAHTDVKASKRTAKHHVVFLSLKDAKSAQPATGDAAAKLVGGMINGMVGVLHDEDVGDEHKKAWCVNETNVAHGIEADKKALIAKTTTEISEQEDQLATLVEEIKGLHEKIAMTDKLVHEATAERKAEHKEFVDAFATSATAIRLIDKAILRLERFYSPEKVAKKEAAVKAAAMKKAGLSLLHQGADGRKIAIAAQRMANTLLPGGFDALLQVHTNSESGASLRLAIRNGVDPFQMPDTPGTYEKKESGGVIGLMNEFKTDLKTDMTESETEEKFAAKDYVRIMSDAQETRKEDVKSLNHKKKSKASLDEKHVASKALLELTEEELHNLELYIVQLRTECDFLVRNFENRHENRVEGEGGLESAETIVTGEEPPTHKEIEERYAEEHTDDDVDEHFPGSPVDDGPDAPHGQAAHAR